MNPEDMAQQLLELGPEGLTQVFVLLDEKLVEMGASLDAVVDQALGGGGDDGGMMMTQGDEANVMTEAPPANGRTRIYA